MLREFVIAATVLLGVSSAALFVPASGPARAEEPAPGAVAPELVAAAQKEGVVVFYVTLETQVATKIAVAFETKYPGIHVQVERNGAERNFQRLAQEYASAIHAADVVESADRSHLLLWKQQGILAPYVPADVLRWPAAERDPDGTYASDIAFLVPIAYNAKLVRPEDVPKSYADLLDPRWRGKLVKAHPGYSGAIMTATFALSRALGWSYYEKLGRQSVMQVQSGTEPPKKLALGARAVAVDGAEPVFLGEIERGAPIKLIYPSEGTPLVEPGAGVMKDAPHPNAARLLASFLFSREGQQILVDYGHFRSFHPEVKDPAGIVSLSQIKVLAVDSAELLKAVDEIKRKYAEYFGT